METFSAVCIHCGYPLDQLRSRSCPECGTAFDPDNPETFQRVLHNPVRIMRVPMASGLGLRSVLEEAGIPTAIEEETGGVIGYTGVPQTAIYVNRSDEVRAREVVADHKNDTSTSPRQEWKCSICGEMIEPQFANCWNCGENEVP